MRILFLEGYSENLTYLKNKEDTETSNFINSEFKISVLNIYENKEDTDKLYRCEHIHLPVTEFIPLKKLDEETIRKHIKRTICKYKLHWDRPNLVYQDLKGAFSIELDADGNIIKDSILDHSDILKKYFQKYIDKYMNYSPY